MPESIRNILDRYFYKEEIQSILEDMGLTVTGNKSSLMKRVISNLSSHSRDLYYLLNFIDKDAIKSICRDYGLSAKGTKDVLIGRIKEADLFGTGASQKIETGFSWIRRLRFHYLFWISLVLTVLFYLILPSIGSQEISIQVASTLMFFFGIWKGLVFLKDRLM